MSEHAPRKQTAKNYRKPMQKWKEAAESYLKQEDASEERLARLDAGEQANALRYLATKMSQKHALNPRDAESLRMILSRAPRGLDIALGAAVLGGGFQAEALSLIKSGVTEEVPRALLGEVARAVSPAKRPALLGAIVHEIATRTAQAAALQLVTCWLEAGHGNDWPMKPGGAPQLHSILLEGLQDHLSGDSALPFWKAYTKSIAPASLDASPEWRSFLLSLERRDGLPEGARQLVASFLREHRELREARSQTPIGQAHEPSASRSLVVALPSEDASVLPAADVPAFVSTRGTERSLSSAPPAGTVEPTPARPESAPPAPAIKPGHPPTPQPAREVESKTEREERTTPPVIESVEDRAGYVQRLRAGKSSLEKLASLLDESEKVHQQLADVRKQLEHARRKHSDVDAERERLEGQVAELKRRTDSQEEQARAASQRAATFEASVRHERSEVARFRDLLAAREADLARLQERSSAQSAEVDRLRTLLNQRETQLEEARREAAEVRADRDRIAVHHDENITAERRLTRESVLAEFRGRIENVLRFEFEEAERFASSEDEKESLQRLGKALRESTKNS